MVHLQKREPEGMRRGCAPSCDDKITPWPCASLSSWHFEYYQRSFKLAQTQRGSLRRSGRDRPTKMQIRICSRSLREYKKGRGINSSSSQHLSPTAPGLPFGNSCSPLLPRDFNDLYHSDPPTEGLRRINLFISSSRSLCPVEVTE